MLAKFWVVWSGSGPKRRNVIRLFTRVAPSSNPLSKLLGAKSKNRGDMMSNTITVYCALARALMMTGEPGGQWEERREEKIADILRTAPTGSGVCQFHMWDESKPERIVFEFSYLHDNEEVYGYSDHKVRVYPCPAFDFKLTVTGHEGDKMTYGTRDYLGDTFRHWLSSHVEAYPADSYEQSFYRVHREEYDRQITSSAQREAGILVSGRGVW